MKTSLTRRIRTLAATCLTLLALSALTGCGTEEDTGPPTDARMVFVHQARVLGNIDLLANGDVVSALALGQISAPIAVPAGSTSFEIRNTGAEATVLETSLDLRVQPYLVAVLGESLDDLRFWTVDDVAPDLAEGQAAARVVNLDSGGFTYDIYLDDAPLATGLVSAQASDFTTVDLTADGEPESRTARLRVFNAGDDPSGRPIAIEPAEVTLGAGRAYMFVLQTKPENPDVLSVTAVSP